MAANPLDLIEPSWRSLPNIEYGYWMVKLGEALENHDDHKGENAFPPPLAGGTRIKESGHQMIALTNEADGGDRYKAAARDAFRPKADLEVSATVNWVVIRSVMENKPSIRANLPLEEKKGKKQLKGSAPLGLAAPTKVKIKRSEDHSGTCYLSLERILGASIYYAQYGQGDPTDETIWIDGGQSDSCRKIEIKGLKPGEVYHFRVRCFGGGHYSPWSQVITVRML